MGSVILVDKTLDGCLINSLDGYLISFCGGCLIAIGDGGVKLLEVGLKSGLLCLIDGCGCSGKLYSLGCGLYIGQNTHLPFVQTVRKMRLQAAKIALRAASSEALPPFSDSLLAAEE